jgi:predicted nucleic acid-binding protein
VKEAAVVDASVALKWFVAEPDSHAALRLVEEHRELSTPVLLLTELANALWKKWRRSLIKVELADAAVIDVQRYFARLVPTEIVLPDAMQLSRSLDHPVYDCCYLALALIENAPLVTADRRLLGVAEGTPYAACVVPLSSWSHPA